MRNEANQIYFFIFIKKKYINMNKKDKKIEMIKSFSSIVYKNFFKEFE